jgi:regulator of protease activity HflC (stomatin/prohibitin superfamily)
VKKIGLIVALVAGIMLATSGCSSISTAPDQVALHYSGGSFSSKNFQNCVNSSTRNYDGPGDSHPAYPASQRNLAFDRNYRPSNDSDSNFDAPAISFVTKDGISMSVDGVLNFLLNTSCTEIKVGKKVYKGGAIQMFHELIGNRYRAYMDGDDTSRGWRNALQIYVYKPLDTAVDRASQGYTYQELYLDPAKKAQWEKDVQAALPALVDRQTDGPVSFFKDFAVTLQKPEPPSAIKSALENQQTRVAQANAAKAQADAEVAQAEAETKVAHERAKQQAAQIAGYGSLDAYLKAQAIANKLNPFQPTYIVSGTQR